MQKKFTFSLIFISLLLTSCSWRTLSEDEYLLVLDKYYEELENKEAVTGARMERVDNKMKEGSITTNTYEGNYSLSFCHSLSLVTKNNEIVSFSEGYIFIKDDTIFSLSSTYNVTSSSYLKKGVYGALIEDVGTDGVNYKESLEEYIKKDVLGYYDPKVILSRAKSYDLQVEGYDKLEKRYHMNDNILEARYSYLLNSDKIEEEIKLIDKKVNYSTYKAYDSTSLIEEERIDYSYDFSINYVDVTTYNLQIGYPTL